MDMKSLQTVAIALVVIGIVLGVGFLILEEFESTMGTDTEAVTLEVVSPTDDGVYVTNNHSTDGINCYNSFAVTGVINTTGGLVISSGNYTTTSLGRISNTSTYEGGDGSWTVNYTYKFGNNSVACEGMNDTITATATIPTWLTIIVLILIVGIILFIVFKVIPSGANSGAEGTIAQV